MRAHLAVVVSLALLGSLGSLGSAQAEFTQSDLERLVKEIETVAPRNEDYAYPIAIRLVESDVINAWTYLEPQDGKLVPQLELMTGLVELAGGDQRILRGVLAHEVAHLSRGHALQGFPHGDLEHLHTRQQEFEADAEGANYLEKLGHERTDMIDMLRLLDRDMKDSPGGVAWLSAVTSNHASPITRAARLAGEGSLFEAVARFEIGLAYMDCRRYSAAIAYFDEARATDWNVFEADLDAASAALQEYYDRLPGAVQEEWLRPEFGPHLTDVLLLKTRAIEITDEDSARYLAALARIERAPSFFSAPMQPFLLATAHVLEPRGDEETLQKGVAELEALLAGDALGGWDAEHLRLRVACNLALGLARLGDETRAARVLLAEQERDASTYMPALAENLGRLPLDGLSDQQAVLAANVLVTYLQWTPVDAPGGREAERSMRHLLDEHSLQMNAEIQRAPVGLCGVATMTIDGHEVGLFQPFTAANEVLGSIPVSGYPNERYPELEFLCWGDNDVIALTERDRLVKLTSYRPGSALELRPVRTAGLRTTYRVRVGMSAAEFEQLLRPAAGSAALQAQDACILGRRSFSTVAESGDDDDEASESAGTTPEPVEEEVWSFYPQLDFGVLIEDDVVAGITVTPVTLPEAR